MSFSTLRTNTQISLMLKLMRGTLSVIMSITMGNRKKSSKLRERALNKVS
jgi:hypothetical protein